MISPDVWLNEMYSFAELICDTEAIRLAWIEKDYSRTPVKDFDELWMEAIDGMDADFFEYDMLTSSIVTPVQKFALAEFLAAMRLVRLVAERGRCTASNMEVRNDKDLLQTVSWKKMQDASAKLVRELEDWKELKSLRNEDLLEDW